MLILQPPSFCEFESLEYVVEISLNDSSLFFEVYNEPNITVNSSELMVDCPAEFEISFTIRNEANQERKWSVFKNGK